MKKIIALFLFIAINFQVNAQQINWISLNKALELQKENPKKIMMDVYTNWCGPCKMLDKQTFQNKDVAAYVNKHYYAVKFNGEGNDSINYKGRPFLNPGYDKTKAKSRNNPHQFTNFMNIKGYPTIAFFDEKAGFLYPLTGFYKPQQLELYLKLFVNDKHKEMTSNDKFQEYYKSFKPVFKTE